MVIFLGDFYVSVTGEPIPDELCKALSYWHKELVWSRKEYRRVVRGSTKKLYKITETLDTDGNPAQVLITYPGFCYRIKQLLENMGYKVSITDERRTNPAFDVKLACSKLREYQKECVCTALLSRGGVISCPTAWGKTHAIGGIIRGYSQEDLKLLGTPTVAVVTPGVDLANKNYKDLAEDILPDREVGLVTGAIKKYSDDVVVVTPDSFCNLNTEEIGLVIYDEVHTLTDSKAAKIMTAVNAIRFGVSATASGRFDGSDKIIEGVFGPQIYSITYKEAVDIGAVVPMIVLWLKVPAPTNWPEYGYHSKDRCYKAGIWQNREFHLLVQQLLQRIPEDKQTLVMVDKLSHMESFIHETGMDITYVHAETSKEIKDRFEHVEMIKPKERKKIYADMAEGSIKRIISSGIYRTGVNFPQLEVVINAEGMGSKIITGQLPGRASRNIDGKNYGLIIDFWHDWDKKLSRRGNEEPGFIKADDLARERHYTDRNLGFAQYTFNTVDELSAFVGWK